MKTPPLSAAIRLALLLGLALPGASADDQPGLDPDGYIRDWLLLAPISLPEGADAGDLLLREQVRGEALLKPSPGDTVDVQGRTLTWQTVSAPTNHVDLNAVLKAQNDRAAGYLVTYVECDREIPDVVMAVGSNDQGRIHLNGVEIYAFTEARPLTLDADRGKVPLKQGVNVIVFKILNEQNSWQGALRLTDRSGHALRGVRIRRSP